MRAASVAFLFVTLALCNANKKTEPTPTYCNMERDPCLLSDDLHCVNLEGSQTTMTSSQYEKIKVCFPKLKSSFIHSGRCSLTEKDCKLNCKNSSTGPVWGKQVYKTKPFNNLCYFVKEVNCNELKRLEGRPIEQTQLLYA